MEAKKEIFKLYNQSREKLTYYLIALSVTAIGFSIVQSSNMILSLWLIPLGLAILTWALSVYCGIMYLKYVLSNLSANYDYFEVIDGTHEDLQGNTHPDYINAAVSGLKSAMRSNSEIGKKYSIYQDKLFYCGIFFYLIWHVSNMYLNTLNG